MEPFIGQIIQTGFPFPIHGYALCEGQIMSIGNNQALFALLGNRYGGDGRTNFALPDLRPTDKKGNPLPWEEGKPVYQIALMGIFPARD